ncbi:DUF6809 family protein [Anaeropeptidivorans aminofermentans]|jgi:hypothetical protein|uniref:DUF6809 family protein n=1 Tax=Anaeropeptidivorans aminofermentans TaxID=2934315 RepID=UPI00202529E5|nr:DUF6809 family protein [Anaeropeptidivorans aminofermentans]MBE6012959.1 hypothetical protein [Lachnospiraceae bacterium]
MRELMEALFYRKRQEAVKSDEIIFWEREIEQSKTKLKKNLTKNQKKLLLRIEDGKNLINEYDTMESFILGFKIGLKIGYEGNGD